MISLEPYLRTLWAFLQAVRAGVVEALPGEKEAHVSYLRLSPDGTWEIIPASPKGISSAGSTDLIIPLVMPLSRIILVAHVETQWLYTQAEAEQAVPVLEAC